MKIMKKILLILAVMAIIFTIYSMQGKVYADYGRSEWNNSYMNAGKREWNINDGYGVTDYGMHVNFAFYYFNNIYCIQRNYEYNDDHFNIYYKINIEGEKATLYLNGKKTHEWTCEENNIMAGILCAGRVHGKSVGLRESGALADNNYSDVQDGIYGYWGTFEKKLNESLGYGENGFFDWRF